MKTGTSILLGTPCFLVVVFYLWSYLNCKEMSGPSNSKEPRPEQVENNLVSSKNQDNDILSTPGVAMDDPRLVQAVRNNVRINKDIVGEGSQSTNFYTYNTNWNMLQPPSLFPTKFENAGYLKPGFNPSAGQVQMVEDILKGLGNDGFFIECGANDGEWHSNTIWVERTLGWKGLLIEADPESYRKLTRKHRKAWMGQFCLANTNQSAKLTFFRNGGVMGSLIKMKEHHLLPPVEVQCVPLYTVLLAANRTQVDFLSLDIEGSELDVLRTVPFDKVIFKVITIEHILIKEGKEALKDFMISKGYLYYGSFTHPQGLAGDSIFLHSSVQLTPKQKQQMKNNA